MAADRELSKNSLDLLYYLYNHRCLSDRHSKSEMAIKRDATPKLNFNITELAKKSGVSHQSTDHVLEKFLHWKVVYPADHRGNMNFYAINLRSPIVRSLYAFNEALIGELYPHLADRGPRVPPVHASRVRPRRDEEAYPPIPAK